MVALRGHPHGLAQHGGHPQRVDGAAHEALAAIGQAHHEGGPGGGEGIGQGHLPIADPDQVLIVEPDEADLNVGPRVAVNTRGDLLYRIGPPRSTKARRI
jgi:hypothetical protein